MEQNYSSLLNRINELEKEVKELKEDRDNKKSVALTSLAYNIKLISTKDKSEYKKLKIELDRYIKEISKEDILG